MCKTRRTSGHGLGWRVRSGETLRLYGRRPLLYSLLMSLDIAAVQAALREDGLDGWLLYDFRGVNPVAARLTGVADSGHMATRRWYYLIPREGTPTRLVHAIESHNLDGVPGDDGRLRRPRRVDQGPRDPARRPAPAGDGVLEGLRHPLPVPGRRRHHRAGAVARRGGGVVGRPDPAVRGGLGRRRAGHPPGRLRPPVSDQGSGARLRPRRARRRPRPHRVRRPAGDGPGVPRRGPVERQRPGRRRAGQRRQPALPPHRRRAPRHRPGRSAAPRSVGQAAVAGLGLRRHHLDGVHRRHGAGPRPGGVDGRRGGARRRHRLRPGRHRRRPRPSAASRSTRPRGRC